MYSDAADEQPNCQSLAVIPPALRTPLRLAIIGCGQGRSRYGAALTKLASVQIAALVDKDLAKAKVWARDIGGRTPAYETFAGLLASDTQFDAVLVATAIERRSEYAQAALLAGKPVLCEVPFASTLTEMDALLDSATQQGRLLLPALPRRFDPWFQAVAEHTKHSRLGELRQIRCDWSFPIEGITDSDDIVTGGWNALVQTLGCQTADLCRWWQGDAKTVSADVNFADISGAGRGRRPLEGTLANIIVAHAHGQSTHQLGRSRSVLPDEKYTLTGSEGTLTLIMSTGTGAVSAPSLRWQPNGSAAERIAPPVEISDTGISAGLVRMRRLLLHFADCVQIHASPLLSCADARAALEIVHAAYLSTQENSKVTLPLRRSPDIIGLLTAFRANPSFLSPGTDKEE